MSFAPVSFVDGDPSKDFFEQNPQLLAISSFAKMSKRKDGSKLMWAVFLIEDPKSKFFQRPEQSRRDLIANDFLGDASFNWGDLHQVILDYNENCISRVARAYKLLTMKYDEMMEIAMTHEINDIKDVGAVGGIIFSKLDDMNTALEKAAEKLAAEIATTKASFRGTERPGAFAGRRQ